MPEKNTASEREFDPRHRIVGAIIIVVLAVIFVPMILNQNEWAPRQPGAKHETQSPDSKIVVMRVEDMRRKRTIPPDASRAKKAENKAGAKNTKPSSKQSAAAKPVSKPEKKVAVSTPKPAAVKKKPQPVIKDGWVVQLGTFANQKNVDRIRTKLSNKGFKVRTESVRLASGTATRVQVGPYGRKAQAETMRKRIESDLGLKGSVLAAR